MDKADQQSKRRHHKSRPPPKQNPIVPPANPATTTTLAPGQLQAASPAINAPKPSSNDSSTGVHQAVATPTATLKKRRYRPRNRNKTISSSDEQVSASIAAIAVNVPTTEPTTVPLSVASRSEPCVEKSPLLKTTATIMAPVPPQPPNKEQVLAEREAKRLAKQAAKHKIVDAGRNLNVQPAGQAPVQDNNAQAQKNEHKTAVDVAPVTAAAAAAEEKSREAVLAEREAKKLAKLAAKNKNTKQSGTEAGQVPPSVPSAVGAVTTPAPSAELGEKLEQLHIAGGEAKDKPVLSKAERRAKQEAQRAAKAVAVAAKQPTVAAAKVVAKTPASSVKKSPTAATTTSATAQAAKQPVLHRVKLFNHLYADRSAAQAAINGYGLHPAVIKLGTQYANRVVVGSNARCIAFLNTMKLVIRDYETPAQKEFTRGLEAAIQPCMAFLQHCRPLSVSITNALRHIKWQITQMSADQPEDEQRGQLLDSVDTYIRDQVEKAAQAISISVQQKISNGDVILTFGCSSLISHILDEAQKRSVDFRVVVVDARPDHEGQEMLRRLVAQGVRCTCVLVNAIGFIMPVVTKVLLGAHALMANGYVMSRAGTAQVALMAKAHNVPVLVCCETHKFSERVQTDAFVYNEIGQPNDLVLRPSVTPAGCRPGGGASALANWEQVPQLTPLNLCYDITPPELVTAVVTELAILPCTSVPVILRIQPS